MSRGLFGYVSGTSTVTSYAYADTVISTTVYDTAGTHTFTVPAGVTYVIANMIGGGGGTQQGATAAGQGGTSSVAFTAGTVTAVGGLPMGTTDTTSTSVWENSEGTKFGGGARMNKYGGNPVRLRANDGAFIRVGGVVTPGQSLTVVVGAGGTAGTGGSAGRNGAVWLEYGPNWKRRCELFKSTGTFNPPVGVTSATAYMIGGGGGCGHGDGGGSDGTSTSVAFSSGTVSAIGGYGDVWGRPSPNFIARRGGCDNSGTGSHSSYAAAGTYASWAEGDSGQYKIATAAVSNGTGVTVTIGAGGAADSGTTGGGSGVCWIEYFVP